MNMNPQKERMMGSEFREHLSCVADALYCYIEDEINKGIESWGEKDMRDDIVIRPETPKDYKDIVSEVM